MILPSKHRKNCESLLGLGSILIDLLNEPISLDRLWNEFSKINNTKKCPTYHSFDNFILALDFLFIVNKIDSNDNKLFLK